MLRGSPSPKEYRCTYQCDNWQIDEQESQRIYRRISHHDIDRGWVDSNGTKRCYDAYVRFLSRVVVSAVRLGYAKDVAAYFNLPYDSCIDV